LAKAALSARQQFHPSHFGWQMPSALYSIRETKRNECFSKWNLPPPLENKGKKVG